MTSYLLCYNEVVKIMLTHLQLAWPAQLDNVYQSRGCKEMSRSGRCITKTLSAELRTSSELGWVSTRVLLPIRDKDAEQA